ncbi:hypothetical protein MMC31_006156 [Peltigera leucophlebia]|nr:hypothetical protein [Peltigera leucophlebia]
MEQQVVDLLAATLEPVATVRTDAERRLEQLYTNEAFPISLVSIASHQSVPLGIRQAALLSLKKLVGKTWSPSFDEFEGPFIIGDATKVHLREAILSLATTGDVERKIAGAASYVVSKIASADFPDAWPSLLSTLLVQIPQAGDAQLHSILLLLGNLVEDGFDEDQFYNSAISLVKYLYDVAVDGAKKLNHRALAVSIFRACFDTMELMYQNNKSSVKQFMQESSDAWLPFFIDVLKIPLPYMPTEEEEDRTSAEVSAWRGLIALKTQVVKALDRIQNMFPQLLSARTLELFGTVWESLQAHLGPYHALYVVENRQGRLEDADRLPYTLDLMVIEELDCIQTLLSTTIVKRELDVQSTPEAMANGTHSTTWLAQVMPILVGYSQITMEDEGLWDVDINIFLSEETSETANYSPRDACSNFVAKLCAWPVFESLLAYSKTTFEDGSSTPRIKESLLYILKHVLAEVGSYGTIIRADSARLLLNYIRSSIQDRDDFLRARAFIVAGALTTAAGDSLLEVVPDFALQSLNAIENDPSDIVKVSCIRVMQDYLKTLPSTSARELQVRTVAAISGFLSSQDLSGIEESPDLLDTLVETLRDAIMADPSLCLEHPALDVLFTLASYGANSWQTTMLVNEAFESITSSMASKGPAAYGQLCAKVLPTLTGALDIGDMTDVSGLSDMAVSLLSSLAENGPEPLPSGFVATIMPKLYRILFSRAEFSLHQSATITIKHILGHDPNQVFDWRDSETGKGGLEIILLIIDRLLGPDVNDASAAEVGGLAVELVEKAGADKLGPYLMQLLRVVAVRLSTADHASFIQNLVLVFARLSLTNAREVVDFLAQVEVDSQTGRKTGLEVVLRKWLDNSATFSGYDAIRQNVIALTQIYKLHDERLNNIHVQGDLIVEQTTRIKTRSQAKKTPDQYSVITVPLKLIKVLIQELANPVSPNTPGISFGTRHSVSDDDDDEWEEEPNVLDLGSPRTREELMNFTELSGRQWDDETQKYLVDFFHAVESEPTFQNLYHSLTDNEREKLQRMDQH